MNADRLKAGAALVVLILSGGAIYLMATRGTALLIDLSLAAGCF